MKRCVLLIAIAFLILRGNAQNIIAAEYFFDSDPGSGNGNVLSTGTPGTTISLDLIIPATGLSEGIHSLCIRTKNSDGAWSLFECRPVYVAVSAGNAADITAAEYFFDIDPGPGNGSPLNIGTSGPVVNFIASVPSGSLSHGIHALGIRTQNALGDWSIVEIRPVYISLATGDMPVIANAEYFVDSDPGIGNGSPLMIPAPGNVVNESYMIPFPPGMGNGEHYLVIRSQDAAGNWSLFETDTFTVSGALPLNWLAFNGRKVNERVDLQWITENEENTSHFEVERSRNGVDFNVIGTVAAQSLSHNEYAFTDSHPFKGVNFYRLKQIDIDGHYTYSVIIKILFTGGNNTLKIFPNPVGKELKFAFDGSGNKIILQIYDESGRFVKSMMLQYNNNFSIPVNELSTGMYHIILSDGILKHEGRFIKQ